MPEAPPNNNKKKPFTFSTWTWKYQMSTWECKICISWAAKTPRGRSRDRQKFFGGLSFVLKLGNSQRAYPAAGNSSTDTDVQRCSKTNISESHTSSICFAFQGVSVPHTSVLRDQESKLDQQRLIKEEKKKGKEDRKKAIFQILHTESLGRVSMELQRPVRNQRISPPKNPSEI